MELKQLITIIHSKIENQYSGKQIKMEHMAAAIGCCTDTYSRYKNGKRDPAAVHNFLELLNLLDKDQDIVEIIRNYKRDVKDKTFSVKSKKREKVKDGK